LRTFENGFAGAVRRADPQMSAITPQNRSASMFDKLKLTLLITAMLIALSLPPVRAAETEGGIAVITVPHPVEQNLLHLVGLMGRGTAIIRGPGDARCQSMHIRLIAGGFWGMEASDRGAPIRIVVRDPRALHRLMRGKEIVSDEHTVVIGQVVSQGGITVTHGLEHHAGFVINPGRNSLAEVFGPHMRRVPCTAIPADLATR